LGQLNVDVNSNKVKVEGTQIQTYIDAGDIGSNDAGNDLTVGGWRRPRRGTQNLEWNMWFD
jgi:hypothetical protein